MRHISFPAVVFLLAMGPACHPETEPHDAPDHRIKIKLGKSLQILPVGRAAGMMKLLRHPDGPLYLNTQSADLSRGLAKSTDGGKTWTVLPLNFEEAPPRQFAAGFGITRDGRLWMLHQQLRLFGQKEDPDNDRTVFFSHSDDGGLTWKSRPFEFGQFAPGAPQDPYTMMDVAACYPNFIEGPDGTLMFSASMRYPDWQDYGQEDQSRPGIRDVLVRSRDGGETWGDPTIVHLHATETDYAVDPGDPDRILAMTRKQRLLLPAEDREQAEKEALIWGTRFSGAEWLWKGGLLLESTDGGRSFREVPGSYAGYYAHRGAILWTKSNVVIVTHNTGYYHDSVPPVPTTCARISLDGGRTWVDGTRSGTKRMNQSTQFLEIVGAATIELEPDRFFTAYKIMAEPRGDRTVGSVQGFFWELERASGKPSG